MRKTMNNKKIKRRKMRNKFKNQSIQKILKKIRNIKMRMDTIQIWIQFKKMNTQRRLTKN